MFTIKSFNMGLVVVALATIMGSGIAAAQSGSTDVLVVPARYTVIQLAGDMAALRDIAIVAYDRHLDTGETVLHFWIAESRSWKRLMLDEYALGAFAKDSLNEMFLIGSDSDIPTEVISGASQAAKVTRISSLSPMVIINTLNESLSLSPREWRVLAERHQLAIQDLNYERRRWGRYGPPKQENDDATATSDPDMGDDGDAAIEGLVPLEVDLPVEEKGLELAPEEAPAAVEEAVQDEIDAVTEFVETEGELTVEPPTEAAVVAVETMDPADK